MALILNGSGTIDGVSVGGIPDATITNAEIVSLEGAKLTGSVPAATMYAGLNATGTAPLYACRAWVNFNGTGTVAIRASGNVSSITDNGVGDYTVNFATAMPDVNYCFQGCGYTHKTYNEHDLNVVRTVSAIRMSVREGNTANYADVAQISVAIFR